MSKHTPGPWEVFTSEGASKPGIETADGKLSIVVFGHEGEESGVAGRTPEEALANARLMAAAPDLLAACKTALPIMRNAVEAGLSGFTKGQTAEVVENHTAVKMLREAIQKAGAQ